MNAHLPAFKPTFGPPDRIDWDKKDAEYLGAVQAEVAGIRGLPGRPMKVSSTAIARNLRILSIVTKRPEKIPLTVRALQAGTESSDNYTIRIIRWVGQCFREEGISPTHREVAARARLFWRRDELPKFKAVIDEVVNELSDQMSLRYAENRVG